MSSAVDDAQLARMLGEGLDEVERRIKARKGIGIKVIEDGVTFRQWCERLAAEGLRIDGKPFTLDNRPAMAWIYDQIPSTVDEAYRLVLVLMKCAQVGFTVMEMLAAIYLGLKFGATIGQAIVGMFLPDINLTGIKSTERFMPIVRSIPKVHALMTQDARNGSGRKAGEGNVNRRRIAQALFVFSWTSGRATTESVPMDVLSFDEVQEMTLEQMEKTVERLSASPVRFTLMGSTANWPDTDIHHWWKKGTQHVFETECPTCSVAKPLDDYFPDCIRWDTERDAYRYICPAGHWIDDTQRGRWVALNPDADPPVNPAVPLLERPLRIRSIHFPQFLSPTISATEMMDAYNSATDMKNFFNRKRGKPYLDPSQVPVTLEHLAHCVTAGAAAGVKWKSRGTKCYMGIDQMGGFNVVWIKERVLDGRQALVHVEEIYSLEAFLRCSELMVAFDVVACAVEINPNYNEAKKFALRHPGRVFIGNSFGAIEEGMINWGDAPKLDSSERRTSKEALDRFTFKMDQYKCMQVSMAKFTSDPPLCLFPDPQGLVQEVVDKGIKQMAAVLPRAFAHFTKTAIVAEKDDETNKYRRVVKKIGIDPHHSYANMLCDVAWARAHGTAHFLMAEDIPESNIERALEAGVNPLPFASLAGQVPAGTCGGCTSFDPVTGSCAERGLLVRKLDPSCDLFEAR